MNILIINGSPRKKGLISQMLGIMQEEAEMRGDTVEMVYTNDLTVKPCTGCMACRTKQKCVLAEDDSQRVLKMMQQADTIIMGAPCYWGNIPGQMKLMFDRQVYGLMRDTPRFPEPLMKGKKILVVDDVISTGESLKAIEALVEAAGGTVCGRMTILAEGDAAKRDDIIYLEKLPMFDSEGEPLE